jgi:hypothetical protein
MPRIGDLSAQRCSDCSSLMYWVPDAVQGEADGREYPGYRCANGHVSERAASAGVGTRLGTEPVPSRIGESSVVPRAAISPRLTWRIKSGSYPLARGRFVGVADCAKLNIRVLFVRVK